jgi:hypothetical protein
MWKKRTRPEVKRSPLLAGRVTSASDTDYINRVFGLQAANFDAAELTKRQL